jgi:hypothetical protein
VKDGKGGYRPVGRGDYEPDGKGGYRLVGKGRYEPDGKGGFRLAVRIKHRMGKIKHGEFGDDDNYDDLEDLYEDLTDDEEKLIAHYLKKRD